MFLVGYNHLISNKLKWNNCFIKNNQDIYLLDLIDFALQEQTEYVLIVTISWAWFNVSYTCMVAKPVKYLKFHNTRILFLLIKKKKRLFQVMLSNINGQQI